MAGKNKKDSIAARINFGGNKEEKPEKKVAKKKQKAKLGFFAAIEAFKNRRD